MPELYSLGGRLVSKEEYNKAKESVSKLSKDDSDTTDEKKETVVIKKKVVKNKSSKK